MGGQGWLEAEKMSDCVKDSFEHCGEEQQSGQTRLAWVKIRWQIQMMILIDRRGSEGANLDNRNL